MIEPAPISPSMTATWLEWAQLAYAAEGPDPLLYLITSAAGAHDALAIIREATSTKSDATQQPRSSPFSQLLKFVRNGEASFGIPQNPGIPTLLSKHITHWTARLNELSYMGSAELTDRLTCSGRYSLMCPANHGWPTALNDLLLRTNSAPPLCLWVDGNIEAVAASTGSVSIVGSREANDYGQKCAHDLAAAAVSRGFEVISGGALGIDASAHWGAVNALERSEPQTGFTVAIFAGGLRNIGPSRNLRLFDEIRASGGALVSELPPDTAPVAARFLARNRLIAALSSCVVVAQARHRSGAINTAQWAAEMGRDVLAIPGAIDSPMNAGCNRLIAEQKATILTDINDIVTFLPSAATAAPNTEEPDLFSTLNSEPQNCEEKPDENSVLRSTVLRAVGRGTTYEALSSKLQNTANSSQINRVLGLLELGGLIQTSASGLITSRKH